MKRMHLIASATAGTLLLASALTSRGAERRAPCPNSLIPAYLHPGDLMGLVERSTLPQLLVINPASGPGGGRNAGYRRAIVAAQAKGARVLGYVATTWGARPQADVEADVDRYRDWYGVDGVFLDEAASAPAGLRYYSALSHHARAAGANVVVLNPGLVPAREYFELADVIVTFEGPIAAYRNRLDHQPAWLGEIPPDHVAHLVYGASREQALEALEPAPRTGYVYLTSGTLPHPWGAVPDYLAPELAALGGCQ